MQEPQPLRLDQPIRSKMPEIWILSFSVTFSHFKCWDLNKKHFKTLCRPDKSVESIGSNFRLWLPIGKDSLSSETVPSVVLVLSRANPQAEGKSLSWPGVGALPYQLPSPVYLIGPITQLTMMNALLGSVP